MVFTKSPRGRPQASFGSQIGQAINQGFQPAFQQGLERGQLQQSLSRANEILSNPNIDEQQKQIGLYEALSGRPDVAKQVYDQYLQRSELQTKQRMAGAERGQNQQIIADLERRRKLPPGSLNAYANDPKMAEQVSRPEKDPKKAISAQPIDPAQLAIIEKVRADPKFESASPTKKYQMLTSKGVSRENAKAESEIAAEELKIGAKKEEKTAQHEAALRAETFPIRKELSDKSNAARAGIQNKENLLDLIKTGKIDDPTYAALAEAFPLNLGKRMLSPETAAYKAGLVDDFRDLATIFKGATRVKEVEIYEGKIADLYLTDEQKEAVLKARINSLKADVIRGEVAAELEREGKFYGALTFEEEVNKRAKPQLEALFNQVWSQTKSIIDNAENKKKVALDANDPDDKQLITQILKETGGDKQKARELAKKKGYKF